MKPGFLKKIVLAATAAFLLLAVGAATSADTFELHVVSQTTSTITLGWDPQPGFGYLFSVNGSLVSRTNDPSRSSAKFSKVTNGVYEVAVIVKGATGVYPPPAPAAQCSDNIDNDGDGKVDFPSDPGCSSATDNDETDVAPPPKPQCSDGLDNDGDGKVDYPADPGCSSATDSDETDPQSTQVTLTPVDGGNSYYGRFANTAGMDASSYFPIGVWGAYNQTAANMNLDAGAGINTYVWAADSSYLPAIRADGRFKVIQDEGDRSNVGTETDGWLLGDEWDMTGQSCPGDVTNVKNSLPADNRMRFFNFGKGLALPPGSANSNWWSDASEQNCFANSVDLDSVDFYWFTDPWQADFCCAYKYGDNIRNLRNADATDGQRHPHWAFVETGDPWSSSDPAPAVSITPPQLRAAVWHSIIAGARGIVYFEHSFRGPCAGDHHNLRTNCEGTRPMVISVDTQIKQLAPVLNSPTVAAGFTSTGSVLAAAKWDGSNFYVLAGTATNGSAQATFSITCVGNATATVIGENRTVPVVNGSFSDGFADTNAIHIYRIDGGGRCGL